MDRMHSESPSENAACRKTSLLSAEELFQWRKKDVLSVPQRGGIKDFEPDGSWLQDKRLEAFYGEHVTVLAEPRVEKCGNLVKGTWDAEKKLVNIEKTAKFWMKMGFAHNDRNWLHPEEALFLMEVNCLDVRHGGVSLSLQEAYAVLLQPASGVSEEEYQVFAHLRRLGYIVLRHAGKLDITPYERKIGLHNYAKKKNKKQSAKSKSVQTQRPEAKLQMDSSISGQQQQHSDCGRVAPGPGEPQSATTETCAVKSDASKLSTHSDCVAMGVKNDRDSENAECKQLYEVKNGDDQKRNKRGCADEVRRMNEAACDRHGEDSATCTETTEPPSKKAKLDNDSGHSKKAKLDNDTELLNKKAKMDSDGWDSSESLTPEVQVWIKATRKSLASPSPSPSRLKLTHWDFGSLRVPDMGGKDTVVLAIPPQHCLPPNTCVDEQYEDVCMFDAQHYRHQHSMSSGREHEDSSKHLRQLEFSYAEWHRKNFRPLTARNWREWKEEFGRREKSFLQDSPVAHLWQGHTTPLVQPCHAQSTDSLLERLSVIQPFHGPIPASKERNEPVKISYDVYLPNTTFRKSCPGLPDHRVCVAKGSVPPNVFEVQAATDHLGDDVPLHWAVVSSGDICFFVFDQLQLPVHPSALG